MLESLVASVLNRVLGSYVENFDPNQLQIGLLSGDVKLHGLKLKKGALDQLKLPINVINGHIGSLVLQIPLSNLKSKPVKVLIEDVFIIAEPDMDYDEESLKRRDQVEKLEKLQLWELNSERAVTRSGISGASSEEETAKQQNFTSSLITKIIENLQVTIRNIHIRFEDLQVGIAVGATLGELSALSTNKDWEPAFIANVDSITHKLVTLDSLAFYIDPEVNTEFSTVKNNAAEEFLSEFKAMIFDSIGSTDILRPINGQGFITMNKKPASENIPRVKADLKFEELSVNLDREQYVDTLRLTERFQNYFNNLKFRKLRPRVSVSENPLAWLKYAAQTVLDGVKEKNKVWTWDAMKKRLDDQKLYIKLYKKWYHEGGSPQGLSPDEKEIFESLQNHYNYSDLAFFRSLAKQELLKENGSLKDSRRPQQQTWSEWLWGSKQAQQQQVPETATDVSAPLQITEEDRLELLDVLDEPTLSQDAASQVLLAVDFSLRSAGIRLKAGDISLASAGFEGVSASFINKPSSFSFEMGLSKFSMSDLTNNNKFSELIRIQQTEDIEPGDFFWFFFEHHPQNKIADSNLFVKSQSIVMVHNARLMDCVVQFFAVPPEQDETVNAIINAANKTVEELREQTRIGLEYALENHKTLNLQLDIKAPTIIIPLDPNDSDSPALVMDVGSLEMASDLVPQNVLQEVKSKQALKYTKDDWKRLESLMYDRFTIKLRDTQILLGEKITSLEAVRGKNSSQYHFLDKTTLQFLLEISIVPNNSSLTKCKLSISLPSLRATLSDMHYKLFMQIIASVTSPSPSDDQNKSVSHVKDEDEVEKKESSHVTVPRNNSTITHSNPQRTFEVNFIVNNVQFFVVSGWNAKPLVDMCLHDFSVKFWTLSNSASESMGVDVVIHDLLISEHVVTEGTTELRKIAESGESHHNNSQAKTKGLFDVKYRKSLSGDMSVDVNLEAIRFNVDSVSVLEIYDYVMTTFTAPNEVQNQPQLSKSTSNSEPSTERKVPELPLGSQKQTDEESAINVTLNMSGVSATLIENLKVVANVSMERTTLNVNLKDAMKAQIILGAVTIRDEANNDVLSIDKGSDLADFRYETQPLVNDVPSGPFLVYLRMGRAKISVLEGPLTEIAKFLGKLTTMKSTYDQARMMAFNQHIQVEPSMFLFDVVISSPIVLWPCGDDWIQLNLGEVSFSNTFTGTVNTLSAGIKNAQVTSQIHGIQKEIIKKTELNLNLVHTPEDDNKSPSIFNVKSALTPVQISASEHQYKLMMMFLVSLSKISQAAATVGLGEEEVGKLRRKLAKDKQIGENKTSYWWGENFSLSIGGSDSNSPQADNRNSLGLIFEAPLFEITLDMNEKPLSKFSINDVAFEVQISPKTGTEATFHIKTLIADDLGNSEKNKFTQIIPPVKHDGYQLMGRLNQEPNKPLSIECSVDSPQMIVALEYLLRIKSFFEYGILENPDEASDESDVESEEESVVTYDSYHTSPISFSRNSSTTDLENSGKTRQDFQSPQIYIDIVDMYLTILADESDEQSEAIVFKIEQFKFNTNSQPTIEISKIGMYLVRMQLYQSFQLRILDDFDIIGWVDNSDSTDNLRLSNVRIKIDPLVLRISMREIGLILGIANKASAIWSSESSERAPSKTKKATNFFADDHRIARTSRRNEIESSLYRDFDDGIEVTRVLSEHLNIECEGFRLVLIDAIHQLPLVDFCIKAFNFEARNWSDSLVAETKAEVFANIHSFTKSAWEPLIDSVEVGVNIDGESVTVSTENIANIEVTSESLGLIQDIQSYFTEVQKPNALISACEEGSPYRIRNETGMNITIWADSKDATNHKRQKIVNNEEVKWVFHDWRVLRENLNAIDQGSSIGIEFEDNSYQPIRNVTVNKIGEQICIVEHNGVKERVAVDVWVKSHLKYISIRSTYLVRNHTDSSLEVKAGDNDKLIYLLPHTSRPIPLELVNSNISFRKDGDEEWSKPVYWGDLTDKSSEIVKCRDDFMLSLLPEIPDVPLSKVYPYLTANINAPFSIINNLPRDVVLRLYCRTTRKESQLPLDKGGRAMIYDFSDDSLLLLRVDIDEYKCDKFAVINTGKRYSREFHIEDRLEVSKSGQNLNLKLEYVDLPNGRGRKIVVYSPYVIMNQTEHDLTISSYTNRLVCSPNSSSMWSFSHEHSHGPEKVSLSCRDGSKSQAVPLDTSGTAAEVKIPSKDRKMEYHCGVAISPGNGRYVNSKIVNVTPRFIICNNMDRPISIQEPGGTREIRISPHKQAPVGFMRVMANKEMCVRFDDSDAATYSSSFAMDNVGSVHVRLTESGKPTILAKVEVILEGATLFVNISKSQSWPFSIRNFTDQEFVFYQSDPYTDEDGYTDKGDVFNPITYRLPARSAMPYSWDLPAALIRNIILEAAPEVKPPTPSRPKRSLDPPRMPPRPSAASSSAASILSRDTIRHEEINQSNSTLPRSRVIKRRKIQIAEIGELPPANFGNGLLVDLSVISDGPQLALIISPYNPESSHYDARTNTVKAEAIDELEAVESATGKTFKLNLRTIGISCITPDSKELFYVTLHNFKVACSLSEAMQSLSLQIQWIQIDNSLSTSTDFPVVLYPTVLPKEAAELAAHPCFSASITKMNDESLGVTYIKHATVLLQEMSIEVDEDFLLGIVNLIIAVANKNNAVGSHMHTYIPILDDDTVLGEDKLEIPKPSIDATPDIYFEQLHLQPVQINLSFVRTGSLSSAEVFKDSEAAGYLAFVIDALTLTIGNINVAPLRFNALLVDNVRTHARNLMAMIQVHYQQEFIYQLHKILGSADVIGNPVGLFNNISSGVMDLFYEPYLGYTLHDRPSEFGVGLAKGGLSFMKKSVFGISDSISRMTGSLSKGLSAMTLDSRYQVQKRARRSRNRPKHAVYGLKYGVESFYDSFSSGVMGLAEQPMQGALTDGSAGFFRGLGVGLLGLPTKTAIGLLDFASNVTEGIKNTTTAFDTHAITRVRLPRVISVDGVIKPYNARESVGQMLLHSVRDGRYAKDHYLAHTNITKNKVVIVSMERVLVVSINESELEWSVNYSQIDSIAVEKTGISITLRGGARGPFIPLEDEPARQYVYKNMAQGVSEFHRKRIAFSPN